MENYFISSTGNFYESFERQKCFKIFKVDENITAKPSYSSRGFRKIYLLTGKTQLYFVGKDIQVDDAILMFEPPSPYSLKLTPGSDSFGCLVSRELLQCDLCLKAYTQVISFSGMEGIALFRLNSKQRDFIACIFKKLMSEQQTGYVFNHELFCNYLNLILYEVLKQSSAMQPGLSLEK